VSGEASRAAVESSALGGTAVAFIFVTLLLDMMALGIVISGPAEADREFCRQRHCQRRAHLRPARNRLCADVVPVLACAGGLSDLFGRGSVTLGEFRARGPLCAGGTGAVAYLAVRGPADLTSASISTAFAYLADVASPEKRAAYFGGDRRRFLALAIAARTLAKK